MKKILIDFWNIKPIYYIYEDGTVLGIRWNANKSLFIDEDGYPSVTLYLKSGKRKKFRINRLVAYAFHGPPPNIDSIAEHIDNDPLNNHKDNIRWGTQSSNQFWRRKTRGLKHKDLTEDDIYTLCKMITDGYTTNEILKHFNIKGKKNDRVRFDRFVKRVSGIKRKVLYRDIYEQCLLESSTTIENDEYYTIDIH